MNRSLAPTRQEAQPATTEITELAPGVLRMQLPISMPGLGHVNCYVLEDRDGVTLVDPGLPGPKAWKALLDRCHRAGFALRHVRSVVVTHSHPDHFGGAGKIRVEAGAQVVTSTTFRTWFDPADDDQELEGAQEPVDRTPPWELPTPWGGPRARPPLKNRLMYTVGGRIMQRWFATPAPSVRLDDAQVFEAGGRGWVALHTPGHTGDHLCLYDPDGQLLLSGDHVLPTITPHISGLDESTPDPLGSFFDSLDKVAALPTRLVLPAHGSPFEALSSRTDAIKEHHRERLDRLRTIVGTLGEVTVDDAMMRLFRPRSWVPMAASETYAHLEHLRLLGDAERFERDGELHYRLR